MPDSGDHNAAKRVSTMADLRTDDKEALKFQLHGRPHLVLPPPNPTPQLTPTTVSPTSVIAGTTAMPTWTGYAARLAVNAGAVAKPSLSVSITPYTPHSLTRGRNAFAEHVRCAPLTSAFLDEVLFPRLTMDEPHRLSQGLVWHDDSVGLASLGRTLTVGFDGTVFFEITMWESRRGGLEWGPDGVDVGSIVDAVLGATTLAGHVWAANDGTRPGWVTIQLSGIQGRHLVYSSWGRTAHAGYAGITRRFPTDVIATTFTMPAAFDTAALTAGLEHLWEDVGYPIQHTVDRDYVHRRISARSLLLSRP